MLAQNIRKEQVAYYIYIAFAKQSMSLNNIRVNHVVIYSLILLFLPYLLLLNVLAFLVFLLS